MRQLILEKLEEAAGKILNPDFVFINSGLPVQAEELPLINIVSRSETAALHETSPRSYEKNFLISVECFSSGNTFLQASTRVNQMSEAIQALVENDKFLNNNKERETFYASTDFDNRSDGEGPISTAVVNFNVRFIECARSDEDDGCLDNLRDITLKWKLVKEETCENASNEQTIEFDKGE